MFSYTYVLSCADGKLYVGSTVDLKRRISQHEAGEVPATSYRLPVRLDYYEACRSEAGARLREKQLKTGFGRRYLVTRLAPSAFRAR
jgi:putative endonuclease